MKILVIGNGGNVDAAVKSSLERHGLEVASAIAPPARKDVPGYLRAVRIALEKCGGADIAVPIFNPETLVASKERFPGLQVMADSEEHIRLLDDKVRACDLAESLGIPQPRRYSSAEEVEVYPVVFKRTFGQGGDSVYFPKTRKALEGLERTASATHLITDYIDGYNLCVDAIRWGDFFDARVYRVLEPVGKGVSTKRASAEAPELISYARKMLEAVDYNGVCGFDFRMDEAAGKAMFLECNPRFSGGLETTIEAGLDLPWVYYSFFTGTAL